MDCCQRGVSRITKADIVNVVFSPIGQYWKFIQQGQSVGEVNRGGQQRCSAGAVSRGGSPPGDGVIVKANITITNVSREMEVYIKTSK